MKNFVSISIGIPAYNEEANIGKLLNLLFKQKISNGKITQIIISSDGSSDKTAKIVRSFGDLRIDLYERKRRLGQNKSQNQILRKAKGDILVLLNADILPSNRNFIQQLIKPFLNDPKVGLVGADTISTAPKTLIEQIIGSSHEFKKSVYKKIKKGNTIYLCHGRARAFSKEFYSRLSFKDNCPEDAYSYLSCITNGFKFVYAPQAKVYFRSPTDISDHAKQSVRFIKGITTLKKYFDPLLIKREYKIPTVILLENVTKFLFNKPLEAFVYFVTSLYIRIFLNKMKVHLSKWEPSKSSKTIYYAKKV
jgi:glycosyltransferase involved in cell wall biosynthesis